MLEREKLRSAYQLASDTLREAMHPDGYWEGRLASSALATATALSALALAAESADLPLINSGVAWLEATQNSDGGWGDTPESLSNLATSLLVASALRLVGVELNASATAYLVQVAGSTPEARVAAVRLRYGNDRTFAVPILMNCALADLVPWEAVPRLPFELAIFPAGWYKALRLHVVSYALPALISVGLLIEAKKKRRCIISSLIRRFVTHSVLRKLERIQPEHGGFLDATPLTAFTAMSLIACFGVESRVVQRSMQFLRNSIRDDGSWPIDTNLSVWLTSSALLALRHDNGLSEATSGQVKSWLLARQYQVVHPFTQAAAGGWGWTHLAGGVPDADDTAGAMLALANCGESTSLRNGARWLVQLQNSDGGWPTFCRGWGQLPFDKSAPDLTAHVLRALQQLASEDPALAGAIKRGFAYLAHTQRADGAWVPLWFGNQLAKGQENPVFGTARVLPAYGQEKLLAQRGIAFLLAAQHHDGGWGGDVGVPASVEETALAVIALAEWRSIAQVQQAYEAGIAYLIKRVHDGSWRTSAPIGLYFASLWYSEELYPVIWTVDALGTALAVASKKR